VTLLALHYCVRAEQRKPVEVLLDRLDRHLPAKHSVALGAVRAELCAVNVSVAIRAVLSNVGENWLGVATGAGYFFMHAAKRIARGVVIEFRNGANGCPACARVAIFAGDVQRTVRTSAGLPLRVCRAAGSENQKSENENPADLERSVNGCPQMT
jgi:hypothetical protein